MHYIAKLCSTSTRKLCWSRLIQLCWIELLQSRAVFITNWGKNCKTLLKNGASIITKWHNFFNRFINRIIKKDGQLKNWSNVDWHRLWLVSQLNFILIISAVFMRTRILKAVIITFVLFSKDMLSEWNHIVGSHSKFKKFYLNFHKIYSHQNWWLRLRNFHLPSHMSFWLCGHTMWNGKIKTLYLHFSNTCKY